MKKSIFSWFGFVQPLEERLELIRDAGFHGVSLWWEDESYPNLIPKENMPEMVKKRGLHLENMHTPYLDVNDLWSDEKYQREETLQRYLGYLEQCNRFDIPVMVMHCSDAGGPESPTSWGLDTFRAIGEKGEKMGVRIAVENTRDAELLDGLLENLHSDFFGMCYDSSHDWITGQSEGWLLEKWSHRVYTTHLSDNDTIKDRHWIPGDGKVDWGKIKKILKKTDLEYVSMELTGSVETIKDPAAFLQKAHDQIHNLVIKE